METNIELGEGQTFVIAGLIDDQVQDQLSRLPGLADLPLLGALFRSRNQTKSKQELVVLVTPEITHPIRPGEVPPLPVMPQQFMAPVTPSSVNSGKSGRK